MESSSCIGATHPSKLPDGHAAAALKLNPNPLQVLAAASALVQESGIELAARPLGAFTDRQLAALAGHAGERRAPLTAAVAMREMRVRAADATRAAWRTHATGGCRCARSFRAAALRASCPQPIKGHRECPR